MVFELCPVFEYHKCPLLRTWEDFPFCQGETWVNSGLQALWITAIVRIHFIQWPSALTTVLNWNTNSPKGHWIQYVWCSLKFSFLFSSFLFKIILLWPMKLIWGLLMVCNPLVEESWNKSYRRYGNSRLVGSFQNKFPWLPICQDNKINHRAKWNCHHIHLLLLLHQNWRSSSQWRQQEWGPWSSHRGLSPVFVGSLMSQKWLVHIPLSGCRRAVPFLHRWGHPDEKLYFFLGPLQSWLFAGVWRVLRTQRSYTPFPNMEGKDTLLPSFLSAFP